MEEDAEDLDPNLYFERRVRAIQVSSVGIVDGLQGARNHLYVECECQIHSLYVESVVLWTGSGLGASLEVCLLSSSVVGLSAAEAQATPADRQNGQWCHALYDASWWNTKQYLHSLLIALQLPERDLLSCALQ